MSRSVTVRPAEPDELVSLLAMGEAMHAESSYSHMPYSPQSAASTMIGLIEDSDGLLLVAENDAGGLVGALLARVTSGYFSTARLAEDLAIFVIPSARNGRVAYEMVLRYINWARSRGVTRIEVSNGAGTNDEAFVKLMRRFDFKVAGSILFQEA